jgi:hypothetical protein
MCWLLGKMSEIMLISLPFNSLEKKYIDLFNSPIFSGGCETPDIESSPDHQLLMSIYNNTNEGARLISKIKLSLKTKQHLLQKSIEEQANDACAAIFAVYIKCYRRINLVRSDLSRPEQEKVHPHLLSLYKYASYVQTFFANLKGQGEDWNERYQQIKSKCLFILLSIKENDWIPIIEENSPHKKVLQRQISHWTKAKHVIRLLRNLMNACIRFKKLILIKKPMANYETILHQSIDHFIYGINDQMKFDLEEFKKSLHRQYQRAMIRLFTYQFIERFILDNQNSNSLIFYLAQLGNSRFEWSYLENIPMANNQEIRRSFYSIIKSLLSSFIKSPSDILIKILFNFLNFNYQSEDISYLYDNQILEIFFQSFISFIDNSQRIISLDLKFLAFNWFRLVTLKLSENIYREELKGLDEHILHKQRNLIFNKFILNELKGLQQIVTDDTNEEHSMNALENVAIGWFVHATKTDHSKRFSSRWEIELCLNQYLVLLMECIYLYDHVRSICANMNYIEELFNIYHRSKHHRGHP